MDSQAPAQVAEPQFYVYFKLDGDDDNDNKYLQFNISTEPLDYTNVDGVEHFSYKFPAFTDQQKNDFQQYLEENDDDEEEWNYYELMFRNTPPYAYIDYVSKILGNIKLAVWHNFSKCMPRYAVMVKYGDSYSEKTLGDIVKYDNNLEWHDMKTN